MSKKEELLSRRAKVAKLYLEGWTQEQLGQQLGVTQQSISNDLKVLREEWREAAKEDTEDLHAQALAQIKKALADLWDQWDLSKLNKYSQPDARLMNEIGKWFDRWTKLLGLNAPDKHELEISDLNPVLNVIIKNEAITAGSDVTPEAG